MKNENDKTLVVVNWFDIPIWKLPYDPEAAAGKNSEGFVVTKGDVIFVIEKTASSVDRESKVLTRHGVGYVRTSFLKNTCV